MRCRHSHFIPSVPNAPLSACSQQPNRRQWAHQAQNGFLWSKLASALGFRGFLWLRASHKSFDLHFLFAILHIVQHWSHTCIQVQFGLIWLKHVGTRFCMQRLWAKSAKREEIKRINQKVSTRSKTMLKISGKKNRTDHNGSENIKQDQKRWKGQSERLQVVRPGDLGNLQTADTLPCTSGFGRCHAPIPSTSAVWSLGAEVNPGCKRYVRNTTKEYKRAIYDILNILSFILIVFILKCKYLQLSQYKQSKYDQIWLLRHIWIHIAAELYTMYIDKNVSVCQVDAASLQGTKCRGFFGIASAQSFCRLVLDAGRAPWVMSVQKQW